MSHNHSISELIEWAWFGILQWIKYVVPDSILTADWVGRDAPGWFREVLHYTKWRFSTTPDGYPEADWFSYYFEAIGLHLGLWIEEVGPWARDAAYSLVRGFTGYVSGNYSTFSQWISGIGNMVGPYVPLGVSTFADAIYKAWYALPSDIRNNLISWSEKFQAATDAAKDWATAFYNDTVGYAYGAYYYVLTRGEELWQWYAGVGVWLAAFKDDPAGTITDALGDTWMQLRRFATYRLDWYRWLMVTHKHDIEDFFSDPITFIYDRAEAWVLDHIW